MKIIYQYTSLDQKLTTTLSGVLINLASTSDQQIVVLPSDNKLNKSVTYFSSKNYVDLNNLDPNVITLDDFLDHIDKTLTVYFNVISSADSQLIANHLNKLFEGKYKAENFYFISKDQSILKSLADLLPDCPLIVQEPWRSHSSRHRALKLKTKYIAMDARYLYAWYVSLVYRSGYYLLAYNLDNLKKAEKWSKRGLYGAIGKYSS